MHTLIDFITKTKGVEYLIAITFMVGFIFFWKFVSQTKVQPARVGVREWARNLGDMIGGFIVPEELYFHQGHAWVRPESNNVVTVGLDDFAQKLVGKIDAIHLPGIKSKVKQGERGWSIEVGTKILDMLAPIDGEILTVNSDLIDSPEIVNNDPYGQGWLMKIRAPRLIANLKNLLSGNISKKWIEEVNSKLLSSLDYNLGLVYQDGGVPIDGMARNIDPDRWEEIAKEFLLVSEE